MVCPKTGWNPLIAIALLDHSNLDPVHLLQAMLDQRGSSVRALLTNAGFDVAGLRNALTKALEALPKIQNPTGDVHMSPSMGRLLNLADKKAAFILFLLYKTKQ